MGELFHERFEIEVGVNEAQRRFINRLHNAIFDEFVRTIDLSLRVRTGGTHDSTNAVVSRMGERKSRKPFSDIVGYDDIYRNLRAVESVWYTLLELGGARPQWFRMLEGSLGSVMAQAEIDLGFRWLNGKFRRTGAAILDSKLVNDVLGWLPKPQYDPVRKPFEKALEHLLQSDKHPQFRSDVVTDMYEALEALAKIVTGRDKELSGNRELFIKKVDATGGYKQLLKDYIDYANEYRHAARQARLKPTLSMKEVESFVYLTGLFLRLAMPS
jgi:hypothetical protein